jgi:hypothetical protein
VPPRRLRRRLEELQGQLAEEVASLVAAVVGPLRALGAWASVYESLEQAEQAVARCAAATSEAQVRRPAGAPASCPAARAPWPPAQAGAQKGRPAPRLRKQGQGQGPTRRGLVCPLPSLPPQAALAISGEAEPQALAAAHQAAATLQQLYSEEAGFASTAAQVARPPAPSSPKHERFVHPRRVTWLGELCLEASAPAAPPAQGGGPDQAG